jgi:hypothetical protein
VIEKNEDLFLHPSQEYGWETVHVYLGNVTRQRNILTLKIVIFLLGIMRHKKNTYLKKPKKPKWLYFF